MGNAHPSTHGSTDGQSGEHVQVISSINQNRPVLFIGGGGARPHGTIPEGGFRSSSCRGAF